MRRLEGQEQPLIQPAVAHKAMIKTIEKLVSLLKMKMNEPSTRDLYENYK